MLCAPELRTPPAVKGEAAHDVPRHHCLIYAHTIHDGQTLGQHLQNYIGVWRLIAIRLSL